MHDMLVKLYELPDEQERKKNLQEQGFFFRRALAPELNLVTDWVQHHFGKLWASEAQVSFSRQPVSCYLAIFEKQIIGFACYETTCRGFFGPTAVLPEFRKKGIGKILLLESLKALREMGYGYAIIGGVGPKDFYKRAVRAILIEGSNPGIYKGLLKNEDKLQ